ncbi:hypothetical protein B0H13DRAFT_2306852 [Mycena leptocephala]|nr:hypothetical protein B0H13DRAFT_2306852 [Mycena leptocephala]
MAAWGFFAAVEKRGFIALPYSTAAWVKANAHPVTVIFTLISTVLAACSSFLFSWGVRQSITLHLHGEGMSMGTFISTLKLSSRSLILDPRKWKWSAMSIALVILTSVQTSGWSGLLTPLQIEIKTPLTGYELDLSSPLLQQMKSGGALDSCVVNSTNLPAFLVGQTESGYAAMKSEMDFPGSLTLMDQRFNISTAGILPMTQLDVNATSFFPNQNVTTIPANLTSAFDIGDDFLSSHYSMMQQGFTANVTCEFQNLTADSTPSLAILSDTVKDWASGSQSFAVTHTEMSSNCVVPDGPELNFADAYTLGDPNYVLMIACGGLAENYTLIFLGNGTYSFLRTTVCTLVSTISTVQVDYSDDGTIGTTPSRKGAVADVNGPAGLSAVSTLFNMQFFAQAMSTNVVGEEIRSTIKDDPYSDDNTALFALENYIRGVAEYSGSVLRACLSVTNGTFVDGAPANMSIPSEGFFYSDIVGWTHVSAATFWVLIPGTLVAIATIWVVLVAVVNHAGDPQREPFDPTNAMHLVSASAAGGLNNVFTGTEEADTTASEGVHVVLETIDGRGPALKVRSGTV